MQLTEAASSEQMDCRVDTCSFKFAVRLSKAFRSATANLALLRIDICSLSYLTLLD